MLNRNAKSIFCTIFVVSVFLDMISCVYTKYSWITWGYYIFFLLASRCYIKNNCFSLVTHLVIRTSEILTHLIFFSCYKKLLSTYKKKFYKVHITAKRFFLSSDPNKLSVRFIRNTSRYFSICGKIFLTKAFYLLDFKALIIGVGDARKQDKM